MSVYGTAGLVNLFHSLVLLPLWPALVLGGGCNIACNSASIVTGAVVNFYHGRRISDFDYDTAERVHCLLAFP